MSSVSDDSSGSHSAMAPWARPSTPKDERAIVALMREVGLQPPKDPDYFSWKYWRGRRDWPGARSFVLSDGVDLLAHAALVPANCLSESGRTRAASMVDWAARQSQVGSGVRIMKHVASFADALLAIGGSTDARKLMPLMGFRARGVVTAFVRPLSPLKLLSASTRPSWKRIPRFIRSLFWVFSAPAPVGHCWSAERITTGEDVQKIESFLPRSRPGLVVIERSVSQLRHMLACPIAPTRLYLVAHDGAPKGYFMLAFVSGQERLVDAAMPSEQPADWQALIECAVREARRDTRAVELAVWASDIRISRALQQTGFHPRFTLPIWLRTGERCCFTEGELRVQMADSDAAYLRDYRAAFWQ